jgi:hypothetical protein
MERKMENKITQRYRLLHSTKEKETIYKGIVSLHPKVDSKQFEEIINSNDTSIEFMDHSAALRETLSFNHHRTGAKMVMNQQQALSYQAKILITNQKVDLILKKVLSIHSKTLIRT